MRCGVGRDRRVVRAGCRRLQPGVRPVAPFVACAGLARARPRQPGRPRGLRRRRGGWWQSPASAFLGGPRTSARRCRCWLSRRSRARSSASSRTKKSIPYPPRAGSSSRAGRQRSGRRRPQLPDARDEVVVSTLPRPRGSAAQQGVEHPAIARTDVAVQLAETHCEETSSLGSAVRRAGRNTGAARRPRGRNGRAASHERLTRR